MNNIVCRLHRAFSMCVDNAFLCYCRLKIYRSHKWTSLQCHTFLLQHKCFLFKKKAITEIWQINAFYQKPPINMVHHIFEISLLFFCFNQFNP